MVPHTDYEIQKVIAEILSEALDMPWYRFIKAARLVQGAREIAKAHKNCCQLDQDF